MTILPCLSRFCGTTDKPCGERCPNRVSCYALKGQKRIRATFRHGTYMQLQECRRAVYLGSWRNFLRGDDGDEVAWNRGLNRSREGIQQQGGAHVRQHDHCIPTRICFSNDITYPCEPTDGRKSMLSPDLGVCIVSPNTWIYIYPRIWRGVYT